MAQLLVLRWYKAEAGGKMVRGVRVSSGLGRGTGGRFGYFVGIYTLSRLDLVAALIR